MSERFLTRATVAIADGSEHDYELVVRYDVTPGSAETGVGQQNPDLYDAGSPDEVHIESVRAFRQPLAEITTSPAPDALEARNGGAS